MAIMLQDDNNRENNEVRRLLGGMPKISAPDNFEYNLMVKIENGNFGLKTEQRSFGVYYKTLIPASALVFTVFVLFFIYTGKGGTVDTLLVVDPAVEDDAVASMHDSVAFREFASTFAAFNREEKTANNQELSNTSITPEGKLETKNNTLAFDNSRSVDLDSYIRGEKRFGDKTGAKASLVSGGEGANRYSRFNGFLYRQNDKNLDILKAKIDSIKKNMMNEAVK